MSRQSPLSSLHLRLLGPVQIERDGAGIGRLESRKALGVLCYLASVGQPVPRADLVSLFWPDKSEQRGRGNLSRVLNNIQSELPGSLEADRHQVSLRQQEYIWIDTHYHTRLARSGQHHLLAAATELHRGEFLADLSVPDCPDFEQWALTEREQWQLRMGQTFQSVIKHHLERGEYDQGLRYATRLLELTPWQEEAHRQKMQLLYLSGQRSAALIQFDICTQVLAYELGVEPSPETVDLAAQIQGSSRALPQASQRQIIQPTLHERGDEHFWLTRQWEETRRGMGKFTLVEGEAGVGKSVLVDEVLAYAASHGAQILRARCYDYTDGMTYEALVNALRPLFRSDSLVLAQARLAQPWLTELSRLWPEVQRQVSSPTPLPEEETSARHRLFEAIAQLLEQTAQGYGDLVLFLDDLHNCDQPTLDLLRYLYHRLHNRAIWFVAAYRREEITPNHPLTLLRNVLIREGVLVEINLHRLSGETIYHVVQNYGGLTSAESQQLTRYLLQESQGNPFALEQVQQWLQEEEILQEKEGRWRLDEARLGQIPQDESGVLPPGMRAMLENRLARLSQRARRLLQTAGVIGQQFDLGVLLRASGEPTDWVEICLASWMARGFIQEIPADSALPAAQHGYRFSHVMLWRVILAELTPLQRQRLEEQIRGG